MKLLQNPALLEKYLAQYEIPQKFDPPGLPFCLWEYERGEILNSIKDPGQVLRFLVSGTIQIYAVRADGSRYPLSHSDSFTLLGDMEFCGENSLPFLVEAMSRVRCVELPLFACREALFHDSTFLRGLLGSVAHKVALFAQSYASYSRLEEKLLACLRQDGGSFRGVEPLAVRLHCSRRQLQRLLKSLTERGILEKTGRGTYRLRESPLP